MRVAYAVTEERAIFEPAPADSFLREKSTKIRAFSPSPICSLFCTDGTDRPEVRRHLRRQPRAHQERRAARGALAAASGHELVVVVSAMAGETNRLIALAKDVQGNPDPRELDVMLSTGEQVTIALLVDGADGAGRARRAAIPARR